MGSGLAAKRSSPPEMRVEVRIDRVVAGLGLEKFLRGMAVPRSLQKDCPSLSPLQALFFSPPRLLLPTHPRILARSCGCAELGLSAWHCGCLPNKRFFFLGKRPPSHHDHRPSWRTSPSNSRCRPCLMVQIKPLFVCLHGGFIFIALKITRTGISLYVLLSIVSHAHPQVSVALPEHAPPMGLVAWPFSSSSSRLKVKVRGLSFSSRVQLLCSACTPVRAHTQSSAPLPQRHVHHQTQATGRQQPGYAPDENVALWWWLPACNSPNSAASRGPSMP